MKLSDFDKVIGLCVDNRRNQWQAFEEQFTSRNANFEKFIVGKGNFLPKDMYSFIDPVDIPGNVPWNNGFSMNAYCCYMSHRAILEKCQREKLSSVLLLEDDCLLTPNFDEILEKVCKQIEDNHLRWDTLTYGQNIKWGNATQLSQNILKLNQGVYCWHAIAINQKYNDMFDHLLSLPAMGAFDYLWANYTQPNFNCYGMWPSIAIQKPGMSYVVGAMQDYTHWLQEKGNNFIV